MAIHLSCLDLNISNVKLTMYFLEVLEKFIDMSLSKSNFKERQNDKLLALLKLYKAYWKHREINEWVKLGYEGTNFFANAIIKHIGKKLNLLSKELRWQPCFSRHEKEDVLFTAANERLGTSNVHQMHFNLIDLLLPSDDLSYLKEPFYLTSKNPLEQRKQMVS